MSIISRFRAINDSQKAAVVRKLLEASTPDFDFFYLTALSTSMATVGLLIDSPSIVVGSMLIAPLLFPILSMSLGLVMSNPKVMARSLTTLLKALIIALGCSVVLTVLTSSEDSLGSIEIISRISPSLEYVLAAVFAGMAVSYVLARPEWSATLPGVAISVALLPPLAVIGIGLASLNVEIMTGAFLTLLYNVIGIMIASMVTFQLMDLYQKQDVAESTIRKEKEKLENEKKVIEEVSSSMEESNVEQNNNHENH